MANETLIIRANAFTGKIEDGYTADNAALANFDQFGTPVRPLRRLRGAAAVGEFIAANPETAVKFLKV